ncbi:ribonuclease P protein subunit Rpp30 [Dermatophagoides pteronyssinus]|uniref:Ribonuclease P protein subunit p30-like n=1 Tax=Dermatophagoides pteronyssinus TaxID=6956 RepID=A0A6P6YFI5_DERPT|nr:ribonuclease P protein subunit p30-like [Dermatophagoides pteronyssinus]
MLIRKMDLNLVIYNDGFNLDKSIEKLIQSCHKFDYKRIALAVQIVATGKDVKIPIPPTIKLRDNLKNIKLYTRLTVQVEDSNSLFHLSKNENLKHYDILAIEPMNEKILNYLNGGNFEFDILTFSSIDSSIVNMIKKANFSLPISKGIGIEINYSNCLSSSSQRRQSIAFGQMLVDKTRSKNIILSSGTSIATSIRSPRDVIYIGLLFGLEENQSKRSLYRNTEAVINHSELRRNINTSIIVADDLIENNNDDNNNESIYDELCAMDENLQTSKKSNKMKRPSSSIEPNQPMIEAISEAKKQKT